MAPTLYLIHASPPVRTVLITAKAIDLDLVEEEVDFFGGEHLKPEYLKLNPQHTVPTLVDDGFAIWDSHAIIIYLLSKYAKEDHALYPKDIKKRAIIDQRLHFESGTMFPRLRNITAAVLRGIKTRIEDKDRDDVNEAYGFFEAFFGDNQWAAGDSLSIADYSLFPTVSSINVLVPIDSSKYPKITAWLQKVQDLPECQINKKGLNAFTELFKQKISNL